MSLNDNYICQYCGLNCHPLAYHEGPKDCQAASKYLAEKLRTVLNEAQPFASSWEFGWWVNIAADVHHAELSKLVGLVKEEKSFSEPFSNG